MERFDLIIVFVLLPLLASCSSNQETMLPSVASEKAEQPDANKLFLVVARHMFDQYAPKDGGVSPSGFHCFIVGTPNDTPELLAEFADFRIPVLGSERLVLKNESPSDEKTGKHAMLWENFDVKDIGEHEATIYVEWMLGPDGAAGYTVQLIQRDGEWFVNSVKEEWMS